MNLIFSWDDLKQILKSHIKKIVLFSAICSALTLIYSLTLPLQYEAVATFKQANVRGDQGFDIKNLLRSFTSGGTEGVSTTLMLSDSVLDKTVQEMGLQAEIQKESKLARLYRPISKNLLGELGILPKDPEPARFSSVKYAGEKALPMILKKISETEYALYDDRQTLLGKGVIGQPLCADEFQFTLESFPQLSEVKMTLHPIQPITQGLRAQLTIKAAREDKNLLVIKCIDKDRKKSAEIVNTLMSMYEKYLVEENKIIIGAQLSYLNQRQDELSSKLDQDIQDHAKVLQNNLQTEGFLGIKDEMDFVLEPLQTHKVRLDEVELELKQIDQRIAKADLETKMSQNEPLLIERYSKALANQAGSAKRVLEQVRRKEKIVSASELEELQPAIEEFNLALEKSETERASKIEELLHEFLNHLASREKSLRESSEWIQTIQNDLSGMSLASARRQFDGYSTQFDDLHAQLKQVMYMRDHLFDPQFEISTLSNVLGDSVTQQIVQKSSNLEAELHDDMHRSIRDRDRLKTTLSIHKRFLQSHLDQTLKLGKIRIDLIKEKLSSLYTAIKTLLMQEQAVLRDKISELKLSMQSLPGLWVHENRLKFRSELTKGMMEGLVSIAETKNLAHHLYQVESRPLDKAKIPLGYIKPRLIAKTTIAFILSCIALAFFAIIQAFIRGFPISITTLRELGAHTSGTLSTASPLHLESIQDMDRETLRRAASFLLECSGKKIVSIIGEKQTAFFPALTALLKKHNHSSIVIDCSFGKIISSEDSPGLFQILNDVSTTVVPSSFNAYDFISVGASSQDSIELLKSSRFKHLLDELSKRYDFIFLISRTSIRSLESEAVLDQSNQAILIAENPLETLKPYIDPSRHKVKNHVTFIQIES